MKHTFSNLLHFKILLFAGSVLLAISASIIFGLIDENLLNLSDPTLATKIVYTTGGIGFVIMVLAGMYYFQYKYRLC